MSVVNVCVGRREKAELIICFRCECGLEAKRRGKIRKVASLLFKVMPRRVRAGGGRRVRGGAGVWWGLCF